MKNSAQDEPFLKDQPPPLPPPIHLLERAGEEGSMNSKTPLLLICTEFQTSLWKDKTWKGIRNKKGNGHKSICC